MLYFHNFAYSTRAFKRYSYFGEQTVSAFLLATF